MRPLSKILFLITAPALFLPISAIAAYLYRGHFPVPEFFTAWAVAFANWCFTLLLNKLIMKYMKTNPFPGFFFHCVRIAIVVLFFYFIYARMPSPVIFLSVFFAGFFAFKISEIIILIFQSAK